MDCVFHQRNSRTSYMRGLVIVLAVFLLALFCAKTEYQASDAPAVMLPHLDKLGEHDLIVAVSTDCYSHCLAPSKSWVYSRVETIVSGAGPSVCDRDHYQPSRCFLNTSRGFKGPARMDSVYLF